MHVEDVIWLSGRRRRRRHFLLLLDGLWPLATKNTKGFIIIIITFFVSTVADPDVSFCIF